MLKIRKRLCCRDIGANCGFVICAKIEKEVFQKAAEHAKTVHNMSEVPKDLHDKARSTIREAQKCWPEETRSRLRMVLG